VPEFVCQTCRNTISYGLGDSISIKEQLKQSKLSMPLVMTNTMCYDQWIYNQTGGECTSCFSRIAKDRYPVNVRDGYKVYCTVFSDMGMSVGDLCMNQVIRDEYVRRNPDEMVVFLEGMTGLDEIREYNPVKVFWANLFTGGPEWVIRDAYWFAVTNEATEFARQGHYARLPMQWRFDDNTKPLSDLMQRFDMDRYVVFHLRNQLGDPKKSAAKNIKPHFVYSIFKLLQNRFKSGMFDAVVLVGNDSVANGYDVPTIEGIIDDSLPIVDLRNRWEGDESLKNIAAICSNAVMTIGRDSGIIQLAAAAGCPKVVAWDFNTRGWFPKAPDGVLSAWVEDESRLEVVLEAVKGVLG